MYLIVNCGSSSLKYKLFDSELGELESNKFSASSGNFVKAADAMLANIKENKDQIEKVGYRIVHGGDDGDDIMPITIAVMRTIEKYSPLAPHHNPHAEVVIKHLIEKLSRAQHFAAFDTAFFRDLPAVTKTYPIDRILAEKYNIKRFGFHGISHRAMMEEVDADKSQKIITLHLGAGSSIAAISSGQPIDTSMGFTPIEGLAMQTRSGDIDPEIVLFLVEKIGPKKTRDMIENYSGMAGISGRSGDMLELLGRDDEASKLAVEIFCYRAKKYLGAYIAALGGVDTVAFSGEIGFGSELIRKKILNDIGYDGFKTKVVKPDEELAIAKLLTHGEK